MTTNLLSLQKKQSVMSTLSVLALLLFSMNVFGQVLTSASPSTITNRTRISLVGTGFTSGTTVKLGTSSATAVSATYTFVNATNAHIVPGATTPDGTLNIYIGSSTVSSGTLYKLAPTATPASARIDQLITDFGGYKLTTGPTTTVANMTNNRHNVTGFHYNSQYYSTGIADGVLDSNLGAGNYIRGDFRALPLNEIIGNTVTSGSSTYIQLGSLVDGDAANAVFTAPTVAGLKIRDVLIDGIKGLDIGTGATNIAADVALIFPIASVNESKINDTEPDIVVSQIAEPGNASSYDIFSFIDANGNIIGNPVQVSFNGIAAIGTNRVDLFRLTNTSYSTAVPNGVNTTNDTKDIRMIAFKISDFGITTAAQAAPIAGFKILPSGSSDPAFIAYNANAFSVPAPVISVQPVSANACTSGASASFSVTATGNDLTYQWRKNGVDIPGATAATYTISNTNSTHAGAYNVVVANFGGSVTSNTVYLTTSGSNTTTWNGSVSSDWNTAANWSCNIVPSATISANVPGQLSRYPVLSTVTGTAFNLNIASGASVTVNQTGVIQIAGDVNKAGTFTAVDGSVSFIGTTGAQIIPANTFATNFIKNLTVNNTSGVTLAGELSLAGILTPAAGTFTTGNQLTLKSNAVTTAIIAPVTGSISGQMTIERYIPSKRAYRFITSATDGGTIRSEWQENGSQVPGWGTDITGTGGATNGFDPSGSNNSSMFTYLNNNTGTANSWIATANTNTSLVAGVPYRLMVRGDRTVNQFLNDSPSTVTTLRTHGTVKTGNVVYSNLTTNPKRYVFVGNPYQAPVNIVDVLSASTGFNKNFYQTWDPTISTRGAYVTVVTDGSNIGKNTVTGSVANQFVQPGQAFFLQTNAATQTLTFAESNKALSTETRMIYSDAQSADMRFTLYEDTAMVQTGIPADGFMVSFNESYDNEVDAMDAIKIGNLDENAGLLNSGKTLSYESRNLPTVSDVIPLFHNQYRGTNYTYKVQVSGLNEVNAYLLDKYNNTRTLLENDAITNVSFSVNLTEAASIATNRFDIVFSTNLGNEESAFSNAVKIYPNPITENQFFIQLPTQQGESLSVKLVNLLGQEVYSKTLNTTDGIARIQPEIPLQTGIYLVNISDGINTATKKLIVK